MAIRDWLPGYMETYVKMYKPTGWPEKGSEEGRMWFKAWHTEFNLARVEESEAQDALFRVAGTPPQFLIDHLPAVLAAVKAIREERGRGAGGASSAIDAAKLASKDCPRCDGTGQTVVWHPQGPDAERRIAATCAAHCVCPLGRHIRARVAEQEPELLKRFVDYEAVARGGTGWLKEDPKLGEYSWAVDPESPMRGLKEQVAADLADALRKRRMTPEGALS